jgi:DNA mismatch endonuclease, patch repair protein
MDRLTPQTRSRIMSRVRGKNTLPELVVRKIAYSLGFRFRLHQKNLPGSPDIVFPKRRTAIFIHGCFWHRHPGCNRASVPQSHTDFWQLKLGRNVERDQAAITALEEMGWHVAVIWECETTNPDTVKELLRRILSDHT